MRKEPTQLVKMQLPLDLVQALKEMAARTSDEFDDSRSLPNMIEVALKWAVFGQLDSEVRERREKWEISKLERLYASES
jgi:hypothetical protein